MTAGKIRAVAGSDLRGCEPGGCERERADRFSARSRSRPRLKQFIFLVILSPLLSSGVVPALAVPLPAERPTVIIIGGASGEPEFAEDIEFQFEAWARASTLAEADCVEIGRGPDSAVTDRERLQQVLAAEPAEGAELWIVMAGHGTFDGREAKFNLRGPDVSATDLAEWLQPFHRPLAIIDTTSSSAPFLGRLAAPGRVIVTSTRSGHEQNYSRFGRFLAEALSDPKSDLDRDDQVSLLEAFLSASHRTSEFYQTENRLATEHALVDDNGDGLGTPAAWFRGVRATQRAREGAALDGVRTHQLHLVRSAEELQLSAEQRTRRDALELKLSRLRERKADAPEGVYFRELEQILIELAELYEGT